MDNYYVEYVFSNKLRLKKTDLTINEALSLFDDMKNICDKVIIGKIIEEEFAVYKKDDNLDSEVYNSDISPFLAQQNRGIISD